MFYYKNKAKAVVIIVVVVLLLAVAVTVCLWDDTSIKSLKATGGTSDYICENSIPLPVPSNITLGDRLTIDGIKYTVGYKGTVNTQTFITLYSDDISSKGMPLVYDSDGTNLNYDGRVSGAHNPGGVKSRIYIGTQNYYATLASKTVTYDKTGVTYGKVSEYIVPHLDYGWSLWLPSVRELNLYGSNGWGDNFYDINLLEGVVQPAMSYYSTDELRTQGIDTSYWLRSPCTGNLTHAFFIWEGNLHMYFVNSAMGAVRVALNLKI